MVGGALPGTQRASMRLPALSLLFGSFPASAGVSGGHGQRRLSAGLIPPLLLCFCPLPLKQLHRRQVSALSGRAARGAKPSMHLCSNLALWGWLERWQLPGWAWLPIWSSCGSTTGVGPGQCRALPIE